MTWNRPGAFQRMVLNAKIKYLVKSFYNTFFANDLLRRQHYQEPDLTVVRL